MNSKEIIKAHGLYQCGMSLSEVAPRFNTTRQRLHYFFKAMGLPTRGKKVHPHVVFNGNKYFKSQSQGYWRKSINDRSMLHRDKWEYFNGKIPDGYDVHHKDENKDNNEIDNFECLPKADHTRLYCVFNNQHTKGKKERTENTPKQCPVCENYFTKKMPSETKKAVVCSVRCLSMWNVKGKK